MNAKIIYIGLGVVVVGFFVYVIMTRPEPAERPGTEQAFLGDAHVNDVENSTAAEPPASGDHGSPIAWGVYDSEVDDAGTIHNFEHGGVLITYRPDLPQADIDRLKALFFAPYAREGFEPTKVILAPRAANEKQIVITSWLRSQTFDAIDEEAMVEYYLRNAGQSPEPGAP